MFNIVAGESSRQLISNLSDQSTNVFLRNSDKGLLFFNNTTFAFILLIIGLILGLILGRRRVVSAIISVYIVSALGVLLPFNSLFSGNKTTIFSVLIGLYILLLIIFSLPGYFSGAGFWYYNRFWMFIFGILLVSLLLVFIFQFAPNSWLSVFPSLAIKIFTSSWYKITATILPLLVLWFVGKNNNE